MGANQKKQPWYVSSVIKYAVIICFRIVHLVFISNNPFYLLSPFHMCYL
jgi:hypothetical protein